MQGVDSIEHTWHLGKTKEATFPAKEQVDGVITELRTQRKSKFYIGRF